MMKNKNLPKYEMIAMTVGELLVSLAVCIVFLAIGKFSLSVLFGSLLGSVVTVLNFCVMVISTDRAIERAMADRGDGEMDDEAAAKFAAEHEAKIQAAVKLSYLLRTVSVAAVLILAFALSDMFHVLAAAVPLLMYQPILVISQRIKERRKQNG